jgi:hypothetical protein
MVFRILLVLLLLSFTVMVFRILLFEVVVLWQRALSLQSYSCSWPMTDGVGVV